MFHAEENNRGWWEAGGETEPEPKKRGHLRFSIRPVALVFAFVCLRVNRIVKKTKTSTRNLVPGHKGGDLAGGCSAAVRLVVQVAVLEVVVVVVLLRLKVQIRVAGHDHRRRQAGQLTATGLDHVEGGCCGGTG